VSDNIIRFPEQEPPEPEFEFDPWYMTEVVDFLGQVESLNADMTVEEFWKRARVIRDDINSWPFPSDE
jgi:hypothetical protein